jgi:non-ribosomal peptide synthetase component F
MQVMFQYLPDSRAFAASFGDAQCGLYDMPGLGQAKVSLQQSGRQRCTSSLLSPGVLTRRSAMPPPLKLLGCPPPSLRCRLVQVDIAVIVNGEGRVVVDYMAELFDEPTIARIFDSFSSLLASMAAAPDAPVASADLFPAGGLRQLLSDLAPGEARPDHLTSPFVHAAFEAHAAAEPDRPCLVFEGKVVTYGEANARANRLAHALAAAGASKGTPIGIMLDRSPELLIAMLAAWKVRRPVGPFCWPCMPLRTSFVPAVVSLAWLHPCISRDLMQSLVRWGPLALCVQSGGVYVPLDPEYPDERLSIYMEDSKAAVLLTQEAHAQRAQQLGGEAATWKVRGQC